MHTQLPQTTAKARSDVRKAERALSPLLALLTLVPLALIFLAAWQSVQNDTLAHDINRSSTLRYRALWMYGATNGASDLVSKPDVEARWRAMQSIRTDLTTRYPDEVARTDRAWAVFSDEMNQNGYVRWEAANGMRDAADRLTDAINNQLHENDKFARLFYLGSALTLALALPWGYTLARKLRETQTALHTSEEGFADASIRYSRLLDGLPAACLAYDREGRIMTWNRAAEILFEKTASQAIGLTIWECLSKPERWERSKGIVTAVINGQIPPDMEWVYSAPSGMQKNVTSKVIPLYGSEGIIGGISTNFDVTESTRAAESLKNLTAELQRSNRELAAFASVASHDLKEPLRKIETFGNLLQRKAGASLEPDARDYLTRMMSASRRMGGLIDGLLEYGRVTTKPRALRHVDLNHVAGEVLEDLEVRVAATSAQVDIDVLPHVWGDPVQMRQLLQNLIGNALKFHAPGAAPYVRVFGNDLEDTPGFAQIVVSDNGIGFAQEQAERIFDVFERLNGASRDYEGSGVGLAICRKIAQQNGGAISAQSAPGEGATFTVTLPTEDNTSPLAPQ